MQDWSEYVDLLKPAADIFGSGTAPVDENLRANFYRQLAMNLSQGYFLIFQTDPRYPEWVPFENSAFLLQPNPDAVYFYTAVDGAGTYRVTGQRGTAPVAGFAVGNRIIGMTEGFGKGFGNYDLDDLTIGEDGAFEVIFSAERPAGWSGDWLHLDPESDFIMVRQFSYAWGRETDMRLAIERLDPQPPKSVITPAEVDRQLRKLFGSYARRLSEIGLGAVRAPHDKGLVNKFGLTTFQDLGNGQDWPQAYFETVFDIGPDEALVIETDLPEQRSYWNIQVIDGLWNQLEVLYRQTSLNGHTAKVDGDGRFRAVLSHRDPGFANWLDTCGHSYGMMIGRWYRCSDQPEPQAIRMKLSDVATYLGDRSPRITPEERAQAMRERLTGSQLRRRW
ncbi:DUF1214 domain-containing protein [Novosphingobium taihuense]|uniref:DUF1214 domain-containing protein n=1 Tax=Novosphingobium taihuense TaxID=260085 RepID=A0A7W7EX56_9SPHN|nr:DUF1214 domain-containing protein [Novosphingobium taihuense]MBB4615005.1 hypothetical protein [Novosphingobium taihuense]TWH84554.1 uncharacterized protein DUF1214 [Novosphingobium taihuense]